MIALKGIMMLASSGKAIASLVTAMSIIAGKTPPAVPPAAVFNPATAIVASQVGTYVAASAAQEITNRDAAKTGATFDIVSATFTGTMAMPRWSHANKNDILGLKGDRPTTINIYNSAVDPKASVDALMKYVKTNGSLPSQLFWNARG